MFCQLILSSAGYQILFIFALLYIFIAFIPPKTMASSKRSVLITGCSEGGMGAALAIAFHEAGLHVYATTRDRSKMANLVALGIETLTLDILSESSIAACVDKVSSAKLDILVNNAGASASMPPLAGKYYTARREVLMARYSDIQIAVIHL